MSLVVEFHVTLFWIILVKGLYIIRIISPPSSFAAFLALFCFIIRFRSSSIFFLASSLALAASDFSFGLDFAAGVFFAAVLLFFTTSGFCKTLTLIFQLNPTQTVAGLKSLNEWGKVLSKPTFMSVSNFSVETLH